MKKTTLVKCLSLLLCVVLVAAIALSISGCSRQSNQAPSASAGSSNDSRKTVLGEGKTVFDFTVVDLEGKETAFEIHTDETTVGAALLALQLIAGDEGSYGLYVKTVNGQTFDYDKDGKYWAFYVNGEYAVSGVDSTEIEAGVVYSFKVE